MTTKTMFHVSGMKCAGCVENVEKALKDVIGYESADVDLEKGSATVAGDVDPQAVCLALTEAGYPSVVKSA
jgi:copper chaperone CopZ